MLCGISVYILKLIFCWTDFYFHLNCCLFLWYYYTWNFFLNFIERLFVANTQKYSWFLDIDLVSKKTLLNLLVSWFWGIPWIFNMPNNVIENKDNFTSFLTWTWWACLLCLTALARNSNTLLNRSDESISIQSFTSMLLALGFIVNVLFQFEKILLYSCLLRVLLWMGVRFSSVAFSELIELILLSMCGIYVSEIIIKIYNF